jgi:hypothetical protein
MERILLIANDNSMTSIVATLITNYVIDFFTQEIGRFTLALIAPLCA